MWRRERKPSAHRSQARPALSRSMRGCGTRNGPAERRWDDRAVAPGSCGTGSHPAPAPDARADVGRLVGDARRLPDSHTTPSRCSSSASDASSPRALSSWRKQAWPLASPRRQCRRMGSCVLHTNSVRGVSEPHRVERSHLSRSVRPTGGGLNATAVAPGQTRVTRSRSGQMSITATWRRLRPCAARCSSRAPS